MNHSKRRYGIQYRGCPGSQMRKHRRHRAWMTDIHAFLRALAKEMFG